MKELNSFKIHANSVSSQYLNNLQYTTKNLAIKQISIKIIADRAERLKGLKLSCNLSSCLFEVLKISYLQDEPLTNRQTYRRQTDGQTDEQTGRQTEK